MIITQTRKFLHIALMLAALALIFSYFRSHDQELNRLSGFTLLQFVGMIALLAMGTVFRALEMKYVLGRLNTFITTMDASFLILYTSVLNYLPMNAGLFMRARILKTNKSLPYARYVALMSAIILLTMMAATVLGLLSLGGVLVSASSGGVASSPSALFLLGGLFLGGMLIPLAIIHIPDHLIKKERGWFHNRLQAMLEGWGQLRGRVIIIASFFTTLKLLMVAGRFWICFTLLSVEGSVVAAILFSAVTSLLLIVNLTPGSLGVRELLSAMLAELVGMNFADGLLAASLDRIVSVIFLAVTGIPSVFYVNMKFASEANET